MQLESVKVLAALLQRTVPAGGAMPLRDVPTMFTAARRHDVHSLAALDRMVTVCACAEVQPQAGVAEKAWSRFAWYGTLAVGLLWYKLAPGAKGMPFFMSMNDPTLGYAAVLRHVRHTAAALGAALVAIAVAAATPLVRTCCSA